MSFPWTVAQVPAWIVWSLVMLIHGAIIYLGFQEGMTGAEPPQHALMMRNIGLSIVGVCIVMALLIRWLRPWMMIRNKSLHIDKTGGWQLLMMFIVCWVLCLVASATSLMIYLVTHDQVMMIVAWCAAFVVTGTLVPRWGGIYASLATPDSPDSANSEP